MEKRRDRFRRRNSKMELTKIKVGVLAGGVSEEREISLRSGKQVFATLVRENIKAEFIEIKTSDPETIKRNIKDAGIDVAFIALHGLFGEDGKIQKILEEIPLAYTGSGPAASFLAMNKAAAKEKFRRNNIPTPSYFLFSAKDFNYKEDISYPVVIKPCFSGSSLGVSIVKESKDLKKALTEAFRFDKLAIAENYIEGSELTVGILDQNPLAVVEIIPKQGYFDFKNKYMGKSKYLAPAKLEKKLYQKVQQAALAAHKALGCRDFSRVDIKLEGDIPYVLEVNSIPGLTKQSLLPLSASGSGISFCQLINTFLQNAITRRMLATKENFNLKRS